tara:strand:+ start:1519 stop:1749 length:231 start_codon:yes stop_codon:yes gene_type:complete
MSNPTIKSMLSQINGGYLADDYRNDPIFARAGINASNSFYYRHPNVTSRTNIREDIRKYIRSRTEQEHKTPGKPGQ